MVRIELHINVKYVIDNFITGIYKHILNMYSYNEILNYTYLNVYTCVLVCSWAVWCTSTCLFVL